MKGIIKHLRRIEAAVYPLQYQLMAHFDIRSWADLAEYCEGRPSVETWRDGYAIWTEEEIVDIASLSPVPLGQLRQIMGKMAETFGSKVVAVDCRGGTSYKLVQLFARQGLLEILGEQEYIWAGERFYSMNLRFRLNRV